MDVQLRHVAGAESGEHRAEWRREHLVDTQVVGDAAAVQRPVAAVREHGELFRKVTPDPEFLGHAVGHLLVDLGLDQLGDLDGLQVEVVAELLVDCERRALHIERNPPAGVLLRDRGSRVARRRQSPSAASRHGRSRPDPGPTLRSADRPEIDWWSRLKLAIDPPPAPSVTRWIMGTLTSHRSITGMKS